MNYSKGLKEAFFVDFIPFPCEVLESSKLSVQACWQEDK